MNIGHRQPLVSRRTIAIVEMLARAGERLARPIEIIGFANYQRLFKDPLFWKAVTNTLYLALVGAPASVLVALGIALLLNTKGIRGIGLYRTVFFLPVIFPAVAASILWLWLLNPPYGLVNQVLNFIGIKGPGWFYDASWAKNGIILMTVWGAGDVIIEYNDQGQDRVIALISAVAAITSANCA